MGLMGQFHRRHRLFLCLYYFTIPHSAFPWCWCLAASAFVLSHGLGYFWLKKGFGRMSEKMANKGPPKIFLFIRAMKKKAKIFGIYFVTYNC